MSTNDQNQEQAGGHGREAASPQQAEGAERGERHGRGRRRGNRPPQQPPRTPPQGRHGRGDSGLDLEELRELTELFSAHGLTDFEFENADIRIRLSRNPAPAAAAPAPAQPLPPPPAPAPPAPAPAPPPPAAEAAPPPAPEPVAAEDLHIITSPIPGTFYRSPSPAADPFVNVGSRIKLGQVVCIIEAMKLMNEIEADVAGTVEKIYVENAQPVEYGQPLFGIKLA